jgi:hypothetical protein
VIKGRVESDVELALIELEYAMAEWRVEYASLRPAGESRDGRRWRCKVIAANHAFDLARLLLSDGSTRQRDAVPRLN